MKPKSDAGKGPSRRDEDFARVQKNWEEIRWSSVKAPRLARNNDPDMTASKSKCCNSYAWVEGHTTQFYVCGKCDKPCDIL